MGLISFMKNAGSKLIGTDDESRAEKLTEEITNTGLSVENLKIVIKEEKATVSGIAFNQAVKEKIILMIGNKDGISEVNDGMTLKQEVKKAIEDNVVKEVEKVVEPKFYTVKKGDTLGKIAKEFYGDPMKYPDIFEANRPMLKDANLIYPGQTLRIPELD